MLYLVNTLLLSVLYPVWVGLSTRSPAVAWCLQSASLYGYVVPGCSAHSHDIKHITGNLQVFPIPSFLTKKPLLAAVPQQGPRRTAAQALHTEHTPSLGGAALGKHPSASATHKEKVSRDFALLFSLHSSHISLSPKNSHTLWVPSTRCLNNKTIT